MTETSRRGHAAPVAGLVAQLLLLVLLAATVGLGAAGWLVGVACAVTIALALTLALTRGADEPAGHAETGPRQDGEQEHLGEQPGRRTRSTRSCLGHVSWNRAESA